MDSNIWGVAGGLTGSVLSLTAIGINQWNRWSDRRAKAKLEHDEEVASNPDRAVTRLSDALEALAEENARLRSMYEQSINDRDSLVKENRELRKEIEDVRTKSNRQNQ